MVLRRIRRTAIPGEMKAFGIFKTKEAGDTIVERADTERDYETSFRRAEASQLQHWPRQARIRFRASSRALIT